MSVRFEVNGKEVEVEVEPRLTLVDCLRHQLRLTGTHVGCEHGVCGACTIIVDGTAVRSCLMLAVQAEGSRIVTVEGLSNDDDLTPLQKSFRKHHALQCGFCTPGMITTAHALLSEEPDCDAARVREVLSGNLCRCTGYIPIVEAVLDARAAYQPKGRDRSGDRARERSTRSSAARSNRCRPWPTAARRRKTHRCCSRTRAPISRSSSAPCAATPTRRLPTRLTSGARVSAPSDTWHYLWSRAGCSRNGTRRAGVSPFPAAPRSCSSIAAPWRNRWGCPKAPSRSWRTMSAAALARAASSIRRTFSFHSRRATPAGR